jgi:heat shock protein HtpX
MIAALERLSGKQAMTQDLPGELTAFGISEEVKEGLKALFSSHPPLAQRISALRSSA